MSTFNQHPAFNYGPSFSDELRWASDRMPRLEISAARKTEALDEAARNMVQIYDSGEAGKFTATRGHIRSDVKDNIRPMLTQSRTEFRSGLYGDSIFSVNYDKNLAGLHDEREMTAWDAAGILSGNPLAKATKFVYDNWNFDEVHEMVDKVDPSFRDFSKDGWIIALDKEFGDQADIMREALVQNGWDPKETGTGTSNAQAYTYLVKRRLRDIYLQQWARSRYDYQDFLTGENSNKFWGGDHGARMLLDIFTDYEILVDLPVTALTGFVGTGLKVAGTGLRTSGKMGRIAQGIRKGKYVSAVWEPEIVAGKYPLLKVGKEGKKVVGEGIFKSSSRRLSLLDAKKRPLITLSEGEAKELYKLGVLKDVPIVKPQILSKRLFPGSTAPTVRGKKIWGRITNAAEVAETSVLMGKSTLAQTIKLGGQNALLQSMGWTGTTVGSTLEFLNFMNISKNIGTLGANAAAAGVWGAATGVGFSLGSQEDAVLMADLTYGIGNHDVTISGGKVVHDSLMFGGAGVVLGGIMSGFMGGFFKHYWNGAKQYGWTSKEFRTNTLLGRPPTSRADGTPAGLVGQIGEEKALLHLANILDQVAKEPGSGARLLDVSMIEKNWLLADDINALLEYFMNRLRGHYIPIDQLEPIIMKYIRDAGKGRPAANMAERIAMNKKRTAQLWREARKDIKTGKKTSSINDPIPERDYSKLTTSQRSKLAEHRETVNLIRTKANKELRKSKELSEATRKEYDDAIDTLEKWHESEGIPFLPSETIPEVRFKDYDLSGTEEGAFLAKIFQISDAIDEAGYRGATKEEISALEQEFKNGLDAIDKQYARKDKRSRRDVLENEFSILMTEVRKAGDEVTATVKEKLLNILIERLGAKAPQGDMAHSTGWFSDVMNASGVGTGLTKLASLGSGYANMVYSIAHEIRMLARMVDNSHEALADDIALVGRMRSVWSAQRQAFRDGGHVISAVNRAETILGPDMTNFIQNLVHKKRITKKEITKEDFFEAGFSPRETAPAMQHLDNILEETNRYFKSYAEKGIEVQLLRKGMDAERYLPMMFVDTMTDEYIMKVGKAAWNIQAQELMDTNFVAWVELEALGLVNLRKDDNGNILGLHSIPEDSFLNMGLSIEKMEPFLVNMSRADLRAFQAIADHKRVELGMDVHTNRMDSLALVLEQKRLEVNKVSPEAAEQYFVGTKGRYLTAINAEDNILAAKELYTLLRQTSEFKRFNPEAAAEHIEFATERIAALERDHGITIVDPIFQPYKETWIADSWKSDLSPGAPAKDPVVIAVNHPEILQNGKIIKEARVVVSDIVGPQDIPTVGILRNLEDSIGTIDRGQQVLHKPVVGEPKFSEPLTVERVVIETSKESLEETRILRANEIYNDKYASDVADNILPKEEAKGMAILDAIKELKDVTPEEFYHTMVKVEGIDELIPSHELQTLKSNLTPDDWNGSAEYLRYNRSFGSADYDMLGSHDLVSLIETLSGHSVTPIEMGVTKRALKNHGITSSDIVDHLTNSKGIREIIAIASTNEIDISKFIVAHIQNVIKDSGKINRRNIVTWLKETNPIPVKHSMLDNLGTPDRISEAVDLINMGQNELSELLPNSEVLIKRGVISVDNDGVATLLKPLQGEDLEVYTKAVEATRSKYESRLTWHQRELIRSNEWDKLSGNVIEIVHRIHTIKQEFINDNLALLASGKQPVNNKVAMLKAIDEEFPGLKLWDPSDDIADDMFVNLLGSLGKVKASRWESDIAIAHKGGISKEMQDFIGPPKKQVEEPVVITAEEVASHIASDITGSLGNKNKPKDIAKRLTQKQKVQKYFPQSTPYQLNNKKYIATKMEEVKRLEYLETVDARITTMTEKLDASIKAVEDEIGKLKELPQDVLDKHASLVLEEVDLRVELYEAQIKREFGGYDKEVTKLEDEILKKEEGMLALSEADLEGRIISDSRDFQEALPAPYRGMSPEQVKKGVIDLKDLRDAVITHKNSLKKGSVKYKELLSEERRLSIGINKLEDALDIDAFSVTSLGSIQEEMQFAVGALENRLLRIQGKRKHMDPKADEIVNHLQRKLDAVVTKQQKLIPLDSLENRGERLQLDKARVEQIKHFRDQDYDLTEWSKTATLHELLDTPLHWWEQGRLAKDASKEVEAELKAIRTQIDKVERKVFGAGKKLTGKPSRRAGTVGDYLYLLKHNPDKAEFYQEDLATIAMNLGIRKGWFAQEAGVSTTALAQEMMDIIQEMTTIGSLNYHKFNATPVEDLMSIAKDIGSPMSKSNAEYLTKNLFAYSRVYHEKTGKFREVRRAKGDRFRGGEKSTVPMGLLLWHAARELRRRKGLKGHSSTIVQFPEAKIIKDNPYADVVDPMSGEWVGASDRFADIFGFEEGSTFGKPLATLYEREGKEQIDGIVRAYFSSEGLPVVQAFEKERQYALVRLIMEEELGGSRIHRNKRLTIGEEMVAPTLSVKKDGSGVTHQYPYRSKIYTKDGRIKPGVVAKMLRERGMVDATVGKIRTDLQALKQFYSETLTIFDDVEGSVKLLNSSPESVRKWISKAFSATSGEESFMGKNASNLLDTPMRGESLIKKSKYFFELHDRAEKELMGSLLDEAERTAILSKVAFAVKQYGYNYDSFLDNIVIYASDPIWYMQGRLGQIKRELIKPEYITIDDHKWFIKHGWARPDHSRTFTIRKGSYGKFNQLNIEKTLIERKLAEIKSEIHTTLARDIEQFDVPVAAKWIPDKEHGATMFNLKDILDGDTIRKKDYLELHGASDSEWKNTIYPQLVKLRKEGFVETVKSRWTLTPKGREYVDANEPIVINVHTPNKSFKSVVNQELLSDKQIKKLLGIDNKSSIKITFRDKDGFTKRTRQQLNNLVTLQRQARDRGDLKRVAAYESDIRGLKAQAMTAETEVGMLLMKELRLIHRELEDIRNMKAYGQEAGPKAFEQFKELTKIYNNGLKRVEFLESRKHQIINSLHEILGRRTYDENTFSFGRSSVFSTRQRKPLASTLDVSQDAGTTSTIGNLLERLEKAGLDKEKINPNYRGATDALTADEKYGEALSGVSTHYTDRAKGKYKNGSTALQDALWAWARRMNGERAGTNSGFTPIMAGGYRNSTGVPHLGDQSRVFDAELLAKHPDFLDFFETDIRKIVANYARTMGAQIRAQEVLNDWLQHLMVGVDKQILKNFRWDDIFQLIENKVNNLTEILNKSGTVKINATERRRLVEAVKLAKHAYYEMIGRPYHEGWMDATDVVKMANNTAQAMFGPGISTAVSLVEFPMAIMARSGDLGGLVNGMGVAGRNIKHLNTLERSDLEGTAFVLDNYVHSGLHRYLASNSDDLESRISTRIRNSWSKMFEGSERSTAMGKAMENINNFLEGTAKIGSEVSGLRLSINMIKAVAVGKAKYAIAHNIDGLMRFGELLDIHKLEAASGPGARTKYIKGVAREAGVDPTLAFRWFRSGLVGDNDGTTLNTVVKNLLRMGSTLEGNSFDLGLMYRGLMDMDHAVGAGRALYEDVFDRFALFLELHAHDLSPEPRGLVRFGLYNSPLGRLFSFYASYPISFFMTYFKKNPSEMGTIGALGAILALSGFEMFHQQVRALARGDDWDETAEKWKEHPWAMMFRHGSSTPWLGYSSGFIRETMFLPMINNYLGDRNYPVSVGRTAGLGAMETVFTGLQDLFNGNLITRGATTASSNARSIDWFATGGDMANANGTAQASKLLEAIYDLVLPTRAFYWVLVDKMFDYEFDPQVADGQETLMRAWNPVLESLQGDEAAYNSLMKDINSTYFNSLVNPEVETRETSRFPRQKIAPKSTAPKPKFYQPSGPQQSTDKPQDVVSQMLETPTYSSIPRDLST